MPRNPVRNAWAALEAGGASRLEHRNASGSAVDPVGALDEIAFALFTGGRPQRVHAEWFSRACWGVFEGKFASFDEAFGLAAGRGKKNETARARHRRGVRERAVSRLIEHVPGGNWAKARAVQLIVKGDVSATSRQSRLALAELAAQDIELPRSTQGIYQIVLAVTKAKSR